MRIADGMMPIAQRTVKIKNASWIWAVSHGAVLFWLCERIRVIIATLRTCPMSRTVPTTDEATP